MSVSRRLCAGCCVRAFSTSSACSFTRSWPATAWRGVTAQKSRLVRLELQHAQTFKSGVLNLSYVPAKD